VEKKKQRVAATQAGLMNMAMMATEGQGISAFETEGGEGGEGAGSGEGGDSGVQ
jgi:hypothetical protein